MIKTVCLAIWLIIGLVLSLPGIIYFTLSREIGIYFNDY